jgi:hypothetical protein
MSIRPLPTFSPSRIQNHPDKKVRPLSQLQLISSRRSRLIRRCYSTSRTRVLMKSRSPLPSSLAPGWVKLPGSRSSLFPFTSSTVSLGSPGYLHPSHPVLFALSGELTRLHLICFFPSFQPFPGNLVSASSTFLASPSGRQLYTSRTRQISKSPNGGGIRRSTRRSSSRLVCGLTLGTPTTS